MLLDFNQIIKKYNLKIKGVIHIGAHYGQEHNLYKENNIKNIAYFEPLKDNFNVLKENIYDQNVKLFNMALGNINGEIEMYVEKNNKGQSSSILEPKIHLTQYPHITFDNKEKVTIFRLDDVGLDINDYNLINIDVQGYELEVFMGSEKTLNNIDYIISEINRDELYKNCVKIEELTDFLSKFGFVLVEQSWDGGNWGDGLFVKNNKQF